MLSYIPITLNKPRVTPKVTISMKKMNGQPLPFSEKDKTHSQVCNHEDEEQLSKFSAELPQAN